MSSMLLICTDMNGSPFYLDFDPILLRSMIGVLPTFHEVGTMKPVVSIIPKHSNFSTFIFVNVYEDYHELFQSLVELLKFCNRK